MPRRNNKLGDVFVRNVSDVYAKMYYSQAEVEKLPQPRRGAPRGNKRAAKSDDQKQIRFQSSLSQRQHGIFQDIMNTYASHIPEGRRKSTTLGLLIEIANMSLKTFYTNPLEEPFIMKPILGTLITNPHDTLLGGYKFIDLNEPATVYRFGINQEGEFTIKINSNGADDVLVGPEAVSVLPVLITYLTSKLTSGRIEVKEYIESLAEGKNDETGDLNS